MSKTNDKLSLVIQAGGESKRMGSPKALVEFNGRPLICNSLLRLGAFVDEVIVTTNDQKSLDFLCSKMKFPGMQFVADLFPNRSALNGIHTALHYASHEYVAIVAVDMLFPSPYLLIAERDKLVQHGADVAVPKTKHGYEPFSAVYRKSTCLPVVKTALEAGQTRANNWYLDLKVVDFTPAMTKRADSRGGLFLNVNTPNELKSIEDKLSKGRFAKIDLACPRSSVDRASVS